ncbi:NAD+ kinase [Halogranum amylolyticum]|uniref:NAD+ kinase n=1 Tax=Halogranum amylolyticum TaxID=660520 RepID=A0A1H8PBK6_9EURY|nr:NAD(+)/NADH kinase [Halogranum amylolyticum]SEO39340.1 NAD+ kinase [Halogranum amylolyticum]
MKVAVLGDEAVARTVDAAGATLADVETADLVLPVGEARFIDVARDGPDVPILPADAALGPYSLPREAIETGVERLLAGDGTSSSHPVFAATTGETTIARGVLDAMLVTSEPARISEYDVAFGGECVNRFRSDGVVVATPLGSRGYARAAGGPVLEPGTGLSVVPVSPFSTQSDTWVAGGDVTLTVARDDGPVELVVDGETVRSIDPHQSVQLTAVDHVDLWRLPSMRWE